MSPKQRKGGPWTTKSHGDTKFTENSPRGPGDPNEDPLENSVKVSQIIFFTWYVYRHYNIQHVFQRFEQQLSEICHCFFLQRKMYSHYAINSTNRHSKTNGHV